jgi:hypothetical protein
MADSTVREALKRGLKIWIVMSERVRARVAELREDFEDVLVEAREEYREEGRQRAATDAQPDAEREAAPVTTAPRRKATRGRARSEERLEATGDPEKATASA